MLGPSLTFRYTLEVKLLMEGDDLEQEAADSNRMHLSLFSESWILKLKATMKFQNRSRQCGSHWLSLRGVVVFNYLWGGIEIFLIF